MTTSIETADNVSAGKLCLVPDCGKAAKWKGLCQTCYGCAKAMIERNETTWEALEVLGLAVLPKNLLRREYIKRVAVKNQIEEKSGADS